MNIYPIQQSIAAQLQSVFDANNLPFVAMDLPDAPSDVKKAIINPIVYVIYTGSDADTSITTNPIAQVRHLRFNIEIQARSLYNANGLFVARDIVEQSLIGFIPTNAQRISLKKDSINLTEDNIWSHVFEIGCDTMLIQKDESEFIIAPSFNSLNEEN